MQVYDACIACTSVCQKAHLGMRRHQTVKKNQVHSFSRYQAMLT